MSASEYARQLAESIVRDGDSASDVLRIDFLQALTQGYGKGWVLRTSSTARGFRLHETSKKHAVPDVREAIDSFARYLAEGSNGSQ